MKTMKHTNSKESEKYGQYTDISENDKRLEYLIREDLLGIGSQEDVYKHFPINRVIRDKHILRVYHLTSEGGITIIQNDTGFYILVLGEDDGRFFLNCSDRYCHFYGSKLSFVAALSEALSLFNNVSKDIIKY